MYRYDRSYMSVAKIFAGLSHDDKYKVGACIVKDGQILSQGWNGMPSGMDNTTRFGPGLTRPEVIHAEANALMKLAKNGGSADEASLFTTHSPCYTCAGLIIQAGIRRVVYDKVYDEEALTYLKERGLEVERINRTKTIPVGQAGRDKCK